MKFQKSAKIDASYNYALSQLFTASSLKKMQSQFQEDNIKFLINNSGIYPKNEEWNLVRGMELAYDYLKKSYRCEYVYKNEIANQLLLKFHNDNSATLLKELSSSSCIADIVIVNGNTTAYEIKTELDSFDRLTKQLSSYQTIYDKLFIVTYPNALEKISNKISRDIGVIVFDYDGKLKIVREASDNQKLFNPNNAVLTLRQMELVNAYKKYVGQIPQMGTAKIHSFCLEWYISLENEDAHIIFFEALKSRQISKQQFEIVKSGPRALKMLLLGDVFTKKFCLNIKEKLSIFD